MTEAMLRECIGGPWDGDKRNFHGQVLFVAMDSLRPIINNSPAYMKAFGPRIGVYDAVELADGWVYVWRGEE